jgi:hypothetical protein
LTIWLIETLLEFAKLFFNTRLNEFYFLKKLIKNLKRKRKNPFFNVIKKKLGPPNQLLPLHMLCIELYLIDIGKASW